MQFIKERRSVTFWIVLIFLIAGAINSLYVSVSISSGNAIACYVVEGCDLVLSSSYARIFGIPLSYIGLVYYVSGFLVLIFLRKSIWGRRILRTLFFLGFVATIYLLYIQAFVLHAFCSSCIISALCCTVLFALSFFTPFRKHAFEPSVS